MAYDNGFAVTYMIWRQTFDGWEIKPRCIREYEFVFVLKGTGRILISNEVYDVSPGDLILFRPGIKNGLRVFDPPYMAFYGMHFMLPTEAEPISLPDVVHLDSPFIMEVLFKQLYDNYLKKDYLYAWRQSILLQQILLELYTLLHKRDEPIDVLRVRKALEFIRQDPCRAIYLEDLLDIAGIKKTVFISSFRKVTGKSPIQYIIQLRLENARDLLQESNLPISRIAEQCGFSDPFYFSRCFRKHFNLPPKQFREKLRNKE